MKKKYPGEVRVVKGEHFEQVAPGRTWPYPFEEELLDLLKQENRFPQQYYYIEDGKSYGLFITYRMRLNLFTFGKLRWHIPVTVVGYPCSLSESGVLTNDKALVLEYVQRMKGAKLVLNCSESEKLKGWCVGETLPGCVFCNRFESTRMYLRSLRSDYRRRIRKAIRACEDLEVKADGNGRELYPLYEQTYRKSEYKLEKLEPGFFEKVEGIRLRFCKGEEIRGFVLLKETGDTLVFMLCGMDYRFPTADLYYYMLYTILDYGITRGFRKIDLGQTSEETKLKLGARVEKKFFYAHHSNPLINGLVRLGKGLLEYQYHFPEYRVFQEEKNESLTGKTGI